MKRTLLMAGALILAFVVSAAIYLQASGMKLTSVRVCSNNEDCFK